MTTAPPPCCASPYRSWLGEVVDASVLRVAALREFLTAQIAKAKAEGVLFSVHLKATMMKVSDPIIFGHVVRAFFPKTFAQYGPALAAAPQPQRRPRRHLQGPGGPGRGRRDQGVLRRRAGRGPGARHGRLRPRHLQPARPE
ncbi:NADP-dependent isocitrate dehydrogenase [Actinomadura keratinilytica]